MSTSPVSYHAINAMRAALAEAKGAYEAGEVPVGAVVMHRQSGELIAVAQNRMRRDSDATAHAEMLALKAAAKKVGNSKLDDYALVVTLEPCAMCAGAIVLSRVGELMFGAWDEKAGMCGSVGDIVRHNRLNHQPEVRGGILEDESKNLIQNFFAELR